MLASEVIKELQKLIDAEGDLPVKHVYSGFIYNSKPYSGNKDYYSDDSFGVSMNVKDCFLIDGDDNGQD
tara:strand:- start:514 stop:720 length:207 start_codon:yes stop_codon:yes gene_type:complete